MRIRKVTLSSDAMTKALELMGYRIYPPHLDAIPTNEPGDAMPRVKDVARVFQEGVTKLIGREPVQHCIKQDEWTNCAVPFWIYAAWLSDEEWLLLRMKCI